MAQIIGCAVLSQSKPSQLKMEGRGKKSLLGRLAHGLASVLLCFFLHVCLVFGLAALWSLA
jgi:hypothetical protein